MKTFISILTLSLFTFFIGEKTQAQGDDLGYVVVDYMKVKPGMWAKYLACEKAWKHIHKQRIADGITTGWQLEQVLFPRGADSEYDFLTINFYKNWDAIGADNFDYQAAIKSVPADQRELVENTGKYRDIVKSEIWRGADYAFPEGGLGKPKYSVENFMHIPPGGWNDYMEMERRFVKPVHEESIKAGNRAGWVLGVMVMPRGQNLEYQVSTVDYYNNWEDMNKSDRDLWEKVYPGMNMAHISKRINSTRTMVRSELRELVDYVD